MKSYNVICPICGHKNMNLYLDETNGWMECEKCGETTVSHPAFIKISKLPHFHMDELDKIEAFISHRQSLSAGN